MLQIKRRSGMNRVYGVLFPRTDQCSGSAIDYLSCSRTTVASWLAIVTACSSLLPPVSPTCSFDFRLLYAIDSTVHRVIEDTVTGCQLC